jgi:3-oxoadipate enol-lactonase
VPTVVGRATVRGASLAYERSGSGPTVVWGHGLSMDMVSDAALPVLLWNRIRADVVRYDARGHGSSDTTADLDAFSWSELAKDQLALADTLGIDRYVTAGASMGCGTALHVGVLAPERTRALVLVIPPTGWETRQAQAQQWDRFATLVETEGIDAMLAARAQLEPPDPFKGDAGRPERRAQLTRRWDPVRLARTMHGATRADLPDREAIGRIRVPVLILAWTGDAVHPRSTAEELTTLMPQAELRLSSTLDEYMAWSAEVDRFLTALG